MKTAKRYVIGRYCSCSALYRSATQLVFGQLNEWIADEEIASNPTFKLVAATIFIEDKQYKNALSLVHKGDSLEQ